MSGPLDVLLRPFSIRREEAASAGLLAAYFFLAMSCVTTVKALQFSDFLDKVGVGWKLPVVYLISAILCIPIVFLFRILARKYSHVGVASGTLLFFFLTLAAAHFGRTPSTWFSFAFFLWSSVFCLLLPTLGWVISYDLYTTREGKRVFGLFGMGGILGGASGAFWTYLFAERLGNARLAIQTLFLLVILQGILALIYRANRRKFALQGGKTHASYRNPGLGLGAARSGSAYLRGIASLVFVSGAVSTLIDMQFLWFLKQRFSAGLGGGEASAEQIATFYAALVAVMYLISGIVQVAATGPLLRRFGVQTALVVLPLTLLAGSAVASIATGFWTAVSLRAADGSLKSSIQRTALEILYVPHAGARGVSFRSFVDLVVNRTGDSMGAVTYLAALYFASPARVIALALIGLTAGALFLGFRLGKGYLESLRGSLHHGGLQRRPDLAEMSVNPETTMANLQTSDRLRLRLAMEQLAGEELGHHTREAAPAPIGEDMLETHISGLYRRPSWLDSVVTLTRHPDPHTAAAAFHLLVREDPLTYMRQLRDSLASDSVPPVVHLAYAETYFDHPERLVKPPQMLGWCQHVSPAVQAILARIMGRTRDSAYLPVLRQWVLADEPELRRGAIEALGRFAEPRFWNLLVGFLVDSQTRQAARRALACYGDQAVENLLSLLHDPKADIRIKQEIPLVLGLIKSSSARSALLIALYWPDAVVSFRALKVFNKTRASHDLSYSEASFLPVLMQWARQYYQTANLYAVARKKKTPAWNLLKKAAAERCSWSVEKIFRTLELFLPRGDAYLSYLAIKGDGKQLRDNAIELIELRLKGEIKQALLPIFAINETREEEVINVGRELFALPSAAPEVLRDGLFFSDSLLQCCIMAVVREEKLVQLREGVEHIADSAHPLVRETARWALRALAN